MSESQKRRIVRPERGSQCHEDGRSTDWFLLDGDMRHFSEIRFLHLEGSADGSGVWGEIQLHGMTEPATIGDGSYYNDKNHEEHLLAGSVNQPDYGFKQLRAIMREHAAQHHKYPFPKQPETP